MSKYRIHVDIYDESQSGKKVKAAIVQSQETITTISESIVNSLKLLNAIDAPKQPKKLLPEMKLIIA